MTPHDPIYIDGNDNFIPANGVTSGLGTENDPYIIENWDNFLPYENTASVGGWIYFSDALLVKPSETHAVDLRHGQVDITFDVKLDWIQTTENYIDIEMWNMWHYDEGPVLELYDALIESGDRGVKVRILISLEECYNQVKYLNDYENITVLKSASDGTHSKYMIVDERRVTVGSTNWSWAAMVQNREFNLCIDNKDVALAYTYLFESVWGASGGSIRGTGKYWECDNLKPLAHDDYVPPEFTTIYDYNTRRIDEAENEILVSLYAYKPSDWDVENEFQNRLIAAADRGVTVKLVIDQQCYKSPDKEKIDELASRDNTYVKVINLWSAPPWDYYGYSHPKIFLVDGCKGSVSSMNWDQFVFDGVGRDVGVAFNNSELYNLIEECFYYTWNASDAYWVEGQDPIPPSDITAPSVKTVSVENITFTSATFKGELLDDGESDKVNVYFLFQTTASDNRYWDYYHPIERVANPCTFQYTIENLKPVTKYMVVAQASNEAGRVQGEKLYFTTKIVRVSISPAENIGLPGGNVAFDVVVTNNGGVTDNYMLENVDNSGWILELENSVLEVPAGENRTTTLTVTIPKNAEPGTEDSIIVTATSQTDNTMSDNDSCIARAVPPKAELGLVTLWNVGLDLNLYLENGSKLVVKFYTWGDVYQGENVVWTGSTPDNVSFSKFVPHPLGKAVEKAGLDLTTDDTENVISTLSTFIVHKVDLEARFLEIPFYWSMALPGSQERLDLETEFMEIPFYWSGAPS